VDEFLRRGEHVVIVGGGNSAGQAAIALAGRGYSVTIVIRGTDLGTSMSRYLIDRIVGRADIEVRFGTLVRSVDGGERLARIELEDIASHARETLAAAALIVLAGADPHTEWLARSLALDDLGYIITGAQLGPGLRHQSPWTGNLRDPYLLETSAPGVFAVGDVRSGSLKRVAAAVGDGSIAARFVSEHLGLRSVSSVPVPDAQRAASARSAPGPQAPGQTGQIR